MKLNVYISIVPYAISQWHHYSMEITPITLEGLRLYEKIRVARPKHPAIRRLKDDEHEVSGSMFISMFDQAIKKQDPTVDAFGLLIMHSHRSIFDEQTLGRINQMLEEHPYLDSSDVSIVHVVEGMPTSSIPLTLEEYVHQLHEMSA